MIRGEQKDVRMPTSPLMPIGTVPVIPPLRAVEDPTKPLAAPNSRELSETVEPVAVPAAN